MNITLKAIKLTVYTFLVSLLFLTAGCANKIPRILESAEEVLNTNSDLTSRFHSVLYYPREISLDFPGLVVGIEKSPVSSITNATDVQTITVPGSGATDEDFKSRLVDSKIMYISHIVENMGKPYGEGNCYHYSAYHQIIDPPVATINKCSISSQPKKLAAKDVYNNSWNAVDILRDKVTSELTNPHMNYTHIVVLSMGWNTDQEEAFRNFNSIMSSLRNSGKENFNPLFIGITWPSMWENSWLDPLYKIASYPTKATDADEVGFSWMGAIIHEALGNLKNKKPIIVIGHSFGARATSMATCVGPAISRDGRLMDRNQIDLLISLQGAFSINRLFKDSGIEKIKYSETCKNARTLTMTASKYDFAVDAGWWVPASGDESSYDEVCHKRKTEEIGCIKVLQNGDIDFERVSGKRVIYLQADDLIRFNAYKSGGGAHSDIYRNQTGAMLWNLIRRYAIR